VWAKQIAAGFHFGSYLDWKYAPKAGTFKKLTDEQKRNIYENLPEAVIRAYGFSLRETTEAAVSKSKIQNWAMKPVVLMDSAVIMYGYKWAENQTKAENPNLKGDALNKAVAQKAREAIELTQGFCGPELSLL
jgi:hypothetical protein